jgi:hypothetical protein
LTEQRRQAARAKVLADRKAGKKNAGASAFDQEHKGLKSKNYTRLVGSGIGPGAFEPVVKVVAVTKKKGLPVAEPAAADEKKVEKPVTSVPVAAAGAAAKPAPKPAAPAAAAAKPAKPAAGAEKKGAGAEKKGAEKKGAGAEKKGKQ